MKIKPVLESKNQRLSDTEDTLLKMLEDDDYFEKHVKKIRKKYNIKEFTKIDLKKIEGEYFHNLNKSLKPDKKLKLIAIDNETKILLLSMTLFLKYKNFPPYWLISFYVFIKYNVFPIFSKNEKIKVFSGNELKNIFNDKVKKVLPKTKVYIEIEDNLGKTELINLIEKKFDIEIKPTLKKTMIFKEKVISKNMPIINISKLIHNFSKKGKTSHQIADYINNQFKVALSDSRVRDIHSEYLKQIKNLRKN